ncbi:MAG: hypothetical protein OER86_09315 [Phycisphaerae bacterium]|nr:hypothetical protein [Phycisphaerae bacterium]
MTDPMLHPEQVEGVVPPGRRWFRLLMYVLAMGLLVGAVYMAITGTDWSKAAEARPADAAAVLGLVAASLALNAVMFCLITRPFEHAQKPIGLVSWLALIAGSSLLNYLPLRPGLFGRVAYLKQQHAIGYRASVVTLVATAVGTTGAYAVLAGITVWWQRMDATWWALCAGGIVAGTLISVPLLSPAVRRLGRAWGRARLRAAVLAWYVLRLADTLCFTGRFYIVARVMGHPLPLETALVLGVVSNFVVLATPLPAGLGLRAWVGGWLLSLGVIQSADGLSLTDGMGILLADRAAEVLVFVSAGLVALVYLHRRTGGRGTNSNAPGHREQTA